jgi:hypothetical protein
MAIDGLLHAESHLGECGGFVGQSVGLLARGRLARCAPAGAQARWELKRQIRREEIWQR